MKKERRDKYVKDEILELLEHKWYMSEQAKRDVGDEAYKDYCEKWAPKFRKKWSEKDITTALEKLDKLIKKTEDKELLSELNECKDLMEEVIEIMEIDIFKESGGKSK